MYVFQLWRFHSTGTLNWKFMYTVMLQTEPNMSETQWPLDLSSGVIWPIVQYVNARVCL